MTAPQTNWVRSLVTLVILAGLLTGCGTKTKVVNIPDQELHMKRIASLYSDFKSSKGGATPKNTAELRTWAETLKKEDLEGRGIKDLADAFKSPRDNQELVVVPTPKNAMMGMSKIIAYEKTGVGGKHWTLGTQGHLQDVTPEELDKLLAEVGQKR